MRSRRSRCFCFFSPCRIAECGDIALTRNALRIGLSTYKKEARRGLSLGPAASHNATAVVAQLCNMRAQNADTRG
jgi:hypothetical protein